MDDGRAADAEGRPATVSTAKTTAVKAIATVAGQEKYQLRIVQLP